MHTDKDAVKIVCSEPKLYRIDTSAILHKKSLLEKYGYWGKGYGTDAKMTLLNHAFNVLNLRKIRSEVVDYNERSLSYSLRCGYQIEGRKKAEVFRHGEYRDIVQLAVFREEWLVLWERYQVGQ